VEDDRLHPGNGLDYVNAPAGDRVYENRFVLWGRMAWGRLQEYEAYEDTQASKAFDDYLVAHDLPGVTSGSS
jgi:hypothetical protein